MPAVTFILLSFFCYNAVAVIVDGSTDHASIAYLAVKIEDPKVGDK